jgi:hypothetical protein
MGYRTYFTLIIDPFPSDEMLREEIGEEISLDELYNDGYDSKWYDHKDDMIELSKKYPDYLFALDGVGEDSADIWREFYRNGKTYRWELEYDMPKFEAELLQ